MLEEGWLKRKSFETDKYFTGGGCFRRLGCEFFGLSTGSKHWFLFCFFLGFFVRLVPEVLSYPYPIGFDTVYYAVRLEEGVIWYHWSRVFTETWLLYALLIPVYRVIGRNPFLFLKTFSSILYGLNSVGIYFFARKGLRWGVEKSFVASFIFSDVRVSILIFMSSNSDKFSHSSSGLKKNSNSICSNSLDLKTKFLGLISFRNAFPI